MLPGLPSRLIEETIGVEVGSKDGIEQEGRRKVGAPDKPGIPFLVPCAIALWAFSASSYSLLESAEESSALNACVISFACCILILLLLAKAAHRKTITILLFVSLGVMLGSLSSWSYHNNVDNITYGQQECLLTLTSDPKKSGRATHTTVECEFDDGRKANAKAFFDDCESIFSGARMRARCQVRELSEEYSHESYFLNLPCQLSVDDFEPLDLDQPFAAIYDLRKTAISALGEHAGDQSGILQALVCGYRQTIQQEGTYENYKACGIAHIVAVSGAHLAIVASAITVILSSLRIPRKASLLASGFLVVAYVTFAGVPISAIRAAVMAIMSLSAGLAGRRNATLNSLAVCIIAFIVHDPSCCVSISLFLSAASTFGIVLFASLISSWIHTPVPIFDKYISTPISLTFASNMATLPFSAGVFGVVPLASPLANILVAPLFSAACLSGLIASIAFCAMPDVGVLAIKAASWIAFPMNWAASAVASIPGSAVEADVDPVAMIVLSAFMMAGLWTLWPKPSRRTIPILMSVLLVVLIVPSFRLPAIPEYKDGDRLVMLDVGQGDSFALQSQGKTLLVDTGNDASKLAESMGRMGIGAVDALVVTHADDDHCGCVSAMPSLSLGARFVSSEGMLECPCRKCSNLKESAESVFGSNNVKGLARGGKITFGHFSIECIWPEKYMAEGGNADSLCMLVRIDSDADGETDWKALMTGDAEAKQLGEMIELGVLEDVDILKVGHHGSKASVDDSSLDVIKPEISLISVGEGNSYGHPAEKVLECLEGCGSEVYRSDIDGSVSVEFLENKINVSKERG